MEGQRNMDKDGLSKLFKENVWRVCLFGQTEKYDTGNDVKSIIVQ